MAVVVMAVVVMAVIVAVVVDSIEGAVCVRTWYSRKIKI